MDNHKEVESALEAFKACNLKNPDTDDSQDSEQEELFTKHYLEALGQHNEEVGSQDVVEAGSS